VTGTRVLVPKLVLGGSRANVNLLSSIACIYISSLGDYCQGRVLQWKKPAAFQAQGTEKTWLYKK